MNFPFNELVSSWNSKTPPGTWIQSEVRPQLDNGHWAKWYILGRWKRLRRRDDPGFHRTSVGGQGDADGFVSIDTLFTKDHPAVAYQLRLTIFRRAGPTARRPSGQPLQRGRFEPDEPAEHVPEPDDMNGHTIDLDVTPFSQETHHGEYPEFDNGGEAWCSPTSTAMVVNYWTRISTPVRADCGRDRPGSIRLCGSRGRLHRPLRLRLPLPGRGQLAVQHGVRGGARARLDVTQLHNLREAEPFIRAGIPLVASVAWQSNKLDGGIKSTNGHLMVIGGFMGNGDVIAYDPASPDNDHAGMCTTASSSRRRGSRPPAGSSTSTARPAGTRRR